MGKVVEVKGVFLGERFRFENPNGDVIVGDVQEEGGENRISVKGQADYGELIEHIPYVFVGQWGEYTNRRTGRTERQFSFQSFCKQQPNGRAGSIAYLKKCAGIGNVTAARLWDSYGPDAVRMLREQPDDCAGKLGFSKLHPDVALKASRLLQEEQAMESCSIAMADLLDGRGFPRVTTKHALKKWGANAPRFIRANPYRLMAFRGCGFKLTDALFLALGGNPKALKRQALCAWHSIASDTEGDTWKYVDTVRVALAGSISGTNVLAERALELARRAKLIVPARTNGVNGPLEWDGDCLWLTTAERFAHESRVVKRLAEMALCESPLRWPEIGKIQGASDHQREE